ncbi:cold-shock protein [Streptomyces sp. H021]|uniref:cold-shock protein n=1 Tax=Streptomyces sp. H021 TaxID=1519486 RepID=UPI00099C52E7|nr:cold shock domain-containing protein [Streptomyces sp. H021]
MSPCGVVKWFDPDRGIGLISQEGAGPDVQAEASAIHGTDGRLRPGEEVHFNVTLDGAGLRADNIHRPVRSETRPPDPSHLVTLHKGAFRPWPAVPHVPEVLKRERGLGTCPGPCRDLRAQDIQVVAPPASPPAAERPAAAPRRPPKTAGRP